MEKTIFIRSRVANSVVSCGNCPKFELIQALCIAFLPASITCNKRVRLKQPRKRGNRFPHCKPMEIFSDTQWQGSPQSMVGSSQISNSSKLLYIILTFKYEDNPIKTAEKERRRRYPKYNPMGDIYCHGNHTEKC